MIAGRAAIAEERGKSREKEVRCARGTRNMGNRLTGDGNVIMGDLVDHRR